MSGPARSGVDRLPREVRRPIRLRFLKRRAWRNHLGNQSVDPLRIYAPESRDEIVAIVQAAEEDGAAVRFVGSGHSWSDVALTDGYLLLPHRLARPLDLEPDLLKSDRRALVRVEAGMRVRELNEWLHGQDLALPNMGGYDGQTIAGVISTSTHGSGIEFGPLSDFVRSMDVVAANGTVYRIEPDPGITDRAKWEQQHPGHRLVEDDTWFEAAKVGMGCLGVIHSFILEVVPAFLLKEERERSTWEDEAERIPEALKENERYELLLSPYAGTKGKHLCMVTTRNRTESMPPWWSSRRRRKLRAEILARMPFIGDGINLVTDLFPKWSPWLLEQAIGAIADDDYTDRSYRVLNIGAANNLPAYSSEIGVEVDAQGTHVRAMEAIFDVADRHRRLGGVYHTAPIALRFVKASDALMSMMHERPTMMIELIQLDRTEGGVELLDAYEEALRELGGRPHWGQINSLTAREGTLESLYPRYPDWRRVHAELNSSGVFDCPFSRRVGIS